MAPNPRVVAAFRAMKDLGISEDQVKPVLKKLLKLYDKNWELIEEENYRALADAIFEEAENKVVSDQKKKSRTRSTNEEGPEEDAQEHEEPERPLKRLRRGQEGPSSSAGNRSPGVGGPSLIMPKLEQEELPATLPSQPPKPAAGNTRDESQADGLRQYSRSRHKQPVSPNPLAIQGGPNSPQPHVTGRSISRRVPHAVRSNEPVVEPGVGLKRKQKVPNARTLIIPKDEPYTDDMPNFEVPIAVIHPGEVSRETRTNGELANVVEESPSNMEIASSSMGEVKISLSCNSAATNFHMPSLDAVMKLMEEKCLRSYKIVDPNFSFKNLMHDMCNGILELGTHSNHESQEKSENAVPALDVSKKPSQDAVHDGDNTETFCIPPSSPNGVPDIVFSDDMVAQQISKLSPARNCLDDSVPRSDNILVNGFTEGNEGNSQSLVAIPQSELSASDIRSLHVINDIARGGENVNISWINEVNKECLPAFQYIPESFIFHGASVSFTIYQIGDKDCCPTCINDCLVSSAPCSCADETGDPYAYTSEGHIKQCFLDECVTVNRNPKKDHYFYCTECPVEKSKNGDEKEPCKGHLRRKFIKECWIKCGCNKQQCGNRVVQRGISCKLQVFMTPDRKGWGLRTLEELPKGAFVCEYVGEILTNVELHERNKQNTKDRSYPVLLDAGWGSGIVDDEKALCLDSTSFGNVARFINHRCSDANLVEIPVEVETPDHSYYHVALFTTRKVDAMEELTRDYGIDFDDQDHPVKPFQCLCGSKSCRDMKRSNRLRSAVTAR